MREFRRKTNNKETGDMESALKIAQSLWRKGGPSKPAAGVLAWVLSEGRVEHRLRAARLLGAMGRSARPALPALIGSLTSAEELTLLAPDEQEVCLQCAESLGRIGKEASDAVRVLEGWLATDDPEATLVAACAIAHIDRSRAEVVLPVLASASQAICPRVSRKAVAAVRALGPLPPKYAALARSSIPALEAATVP
jgi:hypothetical protein